ncbi:hypothetical protein D0C36_19985 [Mucilaginibacter conchicola]|uniref:Uncharacterized protein n=1 Tax=Mucilaginibacter conchicola TaxID=2303333 RepID=A0A372NQK7_9SPHI|nr:hypothetical protein [Mucilaginibacter conchicola]RFZ91219.1 hypothetical protein D0C36_19985 [Mucilaginibacter conchicola]
MISKVIIESGFIKIYDEQGQLTAESRALNKTVAVHGTDFYIVYNPDNNSIESRTASGRLIAEIPKENKIITGIIENTLIVRDGIFIDSYDHNLNKLYTNNSNAAFKKLNGQTFAELRESLSRHLNKINELKKVMISSGQYEYLAELSKVTNQIGQLINDIKD